MKAKIIVSKEDISEGTRGMGSKCMVARAAERQIGKQAYASYRGEEGEQPYLVIEGSRYRLPEWVGRTMAAYDCEEKVEPFEFEVDVAEI